MVHPVFVATCKQPFIDSTHDGQNTFMILSIKTEMNLSPPRIEIDSILSSKKADLWLRVFQMMKNSG